MPVKDFVSVYSAQEKFRLAPLLVGLLVFLAAISAASVSAAGGTQDRETGRYIVLLKDSVDHPGAVANAQVDQRDGRVGFVYRHAMKGYSAFLPKSAVDDLRRDPRVDLVAPDREVEAFAQTIPTGINRIFASGNETLDIDGVDDARADVDIAVLDTGIDYEHPDLDVVARTYCNGSEFSAACVDNTGTDSHGHGTHVAGTAAAIDNGEGVVGVAPGARLWAVKVIDPSGFDSEIAAGVDWVTAHASEIEVANMSLGCACPVPATAAAIEGSVEAGVVYVVAAGNAASNASGTAPANHPDVITVSGLADYNGSPGGGASPTCSNQGADDSSYAGSNWGSVVEVTAPAVCIRSTIPGGGYYENIWGTSMASPHVAGAAAILASQSNPESQADVEAIRATIVEEGNLAWTDTSKDGVQEPLLDVSNEAVFALGEAEEAEAPSATTEAATSVGATAATLRGTVDPNGAKTSYQFEYGTTVGYGSKVPASPENIGSGSEGVEVSEPVGGLAAETEYHFRVVATNAGGTTYGEDKTFVTSAAPEESEWEIEPTPNPSEAEGSAQSLRGVSCIATGLCMAVGSSNSGALTELWSGGEWTMVTSSTGAALNDAVCVQGVVAECGAVGSKSGQAAGQLWKAATGWYSVPTPTPPGASSSELVSVTCALAPPTLECLGVGSYMASGEERPLSMRWNVAKQEFNLLSTPTAGEDSELNGVSCNAPSSCTAVGSYTESGEERSLAMRWNGTTWSVESVPGSEAGGTDTHLEDVACTGAAGAASTRCIAVGANEGGEPQVGVGMYWDGEEWSEVTPEEPASLEGDFALDSVSCISGSECYAVGQYVGSGSETRTLIEQWDGSEWGISPSPNPEGSPWSELQGVSCVAASEDCVAVGSFEGPTRIDTLAMHRE